MWSLTIGLSAAVDERERREGRRLIPPDSRFPLGLRSLLQGHKAACSPLSAIEPDLIYTDILGLGQIQKVALNGWIKHKYVL